MGILYLGKKDTMPVVQEPDRTCVVTDKRTFVNLEFQVDPLVSDSWVTPNAWLVLWVCTWGVKNMTQ